MWIDVDRFQVVGTRVFHPFAAPILPIFVRPLELRMSNTWSRRCDSLCCSRLSVYVDGVVVGAVCCRIEPPGSPEGREALYIMTLGVVAAWRRRNIGTQLLRRVLDSLPRYPSVGELYLHVQTNNEEAIGFYKVRRTLRFGAVLAVFVFF